LQAYRAGAGGVQRPVPHYQGSNRTTDIFRNNVTTEGVNTMARTSAKKKRTKMKIRELKTLILLLRCQFGWANEQDKELSNMIVALICRLNEETEKLAKGEQQ
jgi:hypothetical protein